jgi:phage terminase small subunit
MAGHRPRNMCLSLQMQDFCREYAANGGKAVEAAMKAGFAESTSKCKAHGWTRDGRVAAEIQMYREKLSREANVVPGVSGVVVEGSREWAKQELITIAKTTDHPAIKTGDRINALALLARVGNMAEEAKEELKSKDKGLQITIVTRGGRG